MSRLTLIGYWRSARQPSWPDPAWFVDNDWATPERIQILAHLRGGVVSCVAAGPSWCRFRCTARMCGAAELSDGRFFWPEGLAHYVECHGVRPPHEFVAHALASARSAELRDSAHTLDPENVSVDESWWMHQRGFRQGESFLSPARSGTFAARWTRGAPKLALIRLIRRMPEAQSLSVPTLLEALRSGATVPLLSGVFETPIPPEVLELEAAGFAIEFLPDRGAG